MRSLAALALAATLGFGNRSHYLDFRDPPLTLDQEEERSVKRMKDRARRARYEAWRKEERQRRAEEARIAAEIEAARPKSRQERRALAREAAKDPRRWDRKR